MEVHISDSTNTSKIHLGHEGSESESRVFPSADMNKSLGSYGRALQSGV